MNDFKPKQGEKQKTCNQAQKLYSHKCLMHHWHKRLLLQDKIKIPFSCFHNHENNQATQSLHCYLIEHK